MALAAVLVAALDGAAVNAAEPAVWFCPLDPLLRPEVGYGGSPQYMELFAPDAQWQKAASRVRIFKIYPQWIGAASDADLQRQFADLKRRGIALGLEYGVLTASGTCGKGVEGFGGGTLLKAAERIERNGGTLSYVAMDEPIFFGCLYSGHNACHWTPEQVAAVARTNLMKLLAAYPRVKVGDIEVLGNTPLDLTLEPYRRGIRAFREAGVPLAFFHADLNWKAAPPAQGSLAALRGVVDSEQVPFGVIYDGNGNDPDDAAWISAAQAHMEEAEAAVGAPDQVIFQSWHRCPKKLLPEEAPNSFAHLINAYFRTRTALTSSLTGLGDTLCGKLTTSLGEPVPNAAITVEIRSLAPAGAMGTLSASGVVPVDATEICFGIRANDEGFSGPVRARIREFKLTTKSGSPASLGFQNAADLNGWGGTANAKGERVAAVDRGLLCISAQNGQCVELNSPCTPVAAQGQPFTFSVTAQVASASEGHGCFSLFFLNGRREVSRATIVFRPGSMAVGTARTGTDGGWTMKLPGGRAEKETVIESRYGGDGKYWPAQNSTAAK